MEYKYNQDLKSVDLTDHPEGGRFLEVFRSSCMVKTNTGTEKTALTHIYFSLNPGELSYFHKVSSDEVWNLYKGKGVNLYLWDGTDSLPVCITLSEENNCYCHVVPAGIWQAAEPVSDKILVGCSVAPGFEFTDFTILNREMEAVKKLVTIAPEIDRYIIP